MVAASADIAHAARVDEIRARGHLTCGIAARVEGFTRLRPDGTAEGFEPDLCRAVAAAILGAAGKVRYVAADHIELFVASGEPDLVVRRLTVTLRRALEPGVTFSPVVFYDGTALLVRDQRRFPIPAALMGRTICVRAGSEADVGLTDYFAAAKLAFVRVAEATLDTAAARFDAGACDAMAADLSELGAIRAARAKTKELVILTELLSKEPLSMLTHADDRQFMEIVRWTFNALVAAEELGVTAARAVSRTPSEDPETRRLLGFDPGNGAVLGLPESWAADAIATVGNYGEVFARHLGEQSPIKLPRGHNALWRDGGLMYAWPMR